MNLSGLVHFLCDFALAEEGLERDGRSHGRSQESESGLHVGRLPRDTGNTDVEDTERMCVEVVSSKAAVRQKV